MPRIKTTQLWLESKETRGLYAKAMQYVFIIKKKKKKRRRGKMPIKRALWRRPHKKFPQIFSRLCAITYDALRVFALLASWCRAYTHTHIYIIYLCRLRVYYAYWIYLQHTHTYIHARITQQIPHIERGLCRCEKRVHIIYIIYYIYLCAFSPLSLPPPSLPLLKRNCSAVSHSNSYTHYEAYNYWWIAGNCMLRNESTVEVDFIAHFDSLPYVFFLCL